MGTRSFGSDCPRLAKLVEAWKTLPELLKAAIEAIIQSNA